MFIGSRQSNLVIVLATNSRLRGSEIRLLDLDRDMRVSIVSDASERRSMRGISNVYAISDAGVIAYIQGESVRILDVRHNDLNLVDEGEFDLVVLSRDGRFLAYSRTFPQSPSITIYDRFTGRTAFIEQAYVTAMAWSPDNHQLAMGLPAGDGQHTDFQIYDVQNQYSQDPLGLLLNLSFTTTANFTAFEWLEDESGFLIVSGSAIYHYDLTDERLTFLENCLFDFAPSSERRLTYCDLMQLRVLTTAQGILVVINDDQQYEFTDEPYLPFATLWNYG